MSVFGPVPSELYWNPSVFNLQQALNSCPDHGFFRADDIRVVLQAFSRQPSADLISSALSWILSIQSEVVSWSKGSFMIMSFV